MHSCLHLEPRNNVGIAVGLLVLLFVALPHGACAQASPTVLPPLSGSIGVWGDYDNDGLMDVLLAGTIQGVAGIPDGRFTRLYHNEGGGMFMDTGVVFPQLDNVAAAWGDYDNDGDLDLLLSGLADGTNGPVNVTEVYRNDGSNHFTAIHAGLEPLAQGSVAWVDYDNDGLLDIFVTGLRADGSNWVSQLYHNNGDGTFSLAPVSLPALANGRGSWGDYDNDGDADLLLSGSDVSGTDATYLLRNDGGGIFVSDGVSIPAQHRVISPWGDFDGNGGLDFMTSSGTYPSVIFGPDYHPSLTRNDGNGVLNSAFDYSLDMWLFSANWGDIDNSGRACVVVSGWVPLVPGGGVWGSATKVYIYLGSSWQEVFTLGGWDNRAETWVDFDGDGKLDIFTTGAGLTTFWTNTVAFHRDFPQPPLNPTATFTALDEVMLSWQAPSNTPTTGRGLSYNLRVGRTPGGLEVVSPMADPSTGRRLLQVMGNTSTSKRWRLSGLPPGTYYWSVQSIGQSYTGSPFAPEAMFTVTSSPPFMVTQPVDQTVYAGDNAAFAGSAIGTKPLSYQWRKDGAALTNDGSYAGATSPALTVSNAQPAQAGAYDLVVSNNYGATTSIVARLAVRGEPRITLQPTTQYVLLTRNAGFTVGAAGALSLNYQWYLGGTPLSDDGRLSGATAPALTIQNLQSNDIGGYYVIVSNAWGMATSSVAMLSLATARYVNVNNPAPSPPYTSWGAAATVIQDAIDASSIGDWVFVTNGVYQTGGRVVGDKKWNRVVLTNQVTLLSVNGAGVTRIVGDVPPNHHTYGTRGVWLGSGAHLSGFTVSGGGNYLGIYNSGLYDQSGGGIWCESSSAGITDCIINGNTGCSYGGGVYNGTLINCALTGNSAWQFSQGGQGGGAYVSTLINCTVVGNSAALAGGTAHCNATNSIIYYNSSSPFPDTNYLQGYGSFANCCTTPLPGGSGNLTNEPVFVDLAGGNYHLQASSPCINAGNNALVTSPVDLDGAPRVVDGIVDLGAYEYQHLPFVIVPPVSQSVLIYSNVAFAVLALGDQPLTYQWQKDGVNLADDARVSGTSTPSLVISNLLIPDVGGYRVVVTNASGSVTSAVAELTLLGPPSISVQPISRTVPAGTNVTFSVAASGLATLSYQWRLNQTELSARTNTSLSLTNVQSANAGDYDVVITNIYGSITSAVATLTVLPAAPAITTQAVSRVVSVGQNASFTVAARGSEPMSCQWQLNGANLPGATSFTLALSNVNASFTGAYRAAISNAAGFAFSTNVTLIVSPVLLWGLTNNPQLQVNAAIPATATNVIALAAGAGTDQSSLPCMALRADGTLATWGYFSRDPAPPTNAVDLVAISVGVFGTTANNLVLRADGTVVNWTSSIKPPLPVVPTNTTFMAVAAGASHQLALRDDGTVIAWGSSTFGQTNVPPGATNVIAIAAGMNHSLALRADGTVVGWGLNTSGQATALSNAVNVVAITAGGNQSLALLADGSVVGRIVSNTPTVSVIYGPPVGNTTNKIGIAAGGYHSLALGMDRTINGWGATNFGALTIPNYATNVVAIAAGGYDSLALVRDPFAPPIPPRIARPPLARTVGAGQDAVFNALAVGGPPLSFQWYRDGAPVPGQSRASLALTNVLPSDAGSYQLVAMNTFGSATSVVAAVTVSIPQPKLRSFGVAGGGFRFNFQSLPGVLYVTEYRDRLGAGAWTELERRFGAGGLEVVADTSAGGLARFYRVRALYAPPPRMNSAAWTANAVSFGFPTVDGAVYVVQYKTNLTDSAWLELSRQAGTGAPIVVNDPNPHGPGRFYRLKVE